MGPDEARRLPAILDRPFVTLGRYDVHADRCGSAASIEDGLMGIFFEILDGSKGRCVGRAHAHARRDPGAV